MSFPVYRTYKDSAVEWLGVVPSHWTVCGLGHRLKSPPCYGVLVPDFDPNGVPMLKIMDLASGVPDRSQLTTISQDLSSEYQRTLVSSGDVVLSVVGTIGSVLLVPEALDGINLSRALARLLPNPELLPRWLMWILSSGSFTKFVDLVCVGSAQRVLNMDDLRAFRAPFPPLAEQAVIASFLDREIAKIDALVEEQRRLIELLKEKRQAVISQAVTKGLNPNVPMKDSGVKWLGEVPAHWEVKRFRDACASISTGPFGTALGSDDYIDNGVPVINPSHIVGNKIVPDEEISVSTETADRLSSWWLRAGDIVVARRGELGRAAVVGPESDGCICGTGSLKVAVNVARATAGFLHAVLQSMYAREWLNQSSVGSTMANLNEGILGRLPLALPSSTAEQLELTKAMNQRLTELEGVETLAEECVARLHERRAALISAAVTGKIDVRGFLPQPEAIAA